jgi:hypothetical protein
MFLEVTDLTTPNDIRDNASTFSSASSPLAASLTILSSGRCFKNPAQRSENPVDHRQQVL